MPTTRTYSPLPPMILAGDIFCADPCGPREPDPRPHTYGVRVGPCRASATEPCRPTACIPSVQPPTFYQAASPDGDEWAVVATAAHFLAQSPSNHCSLITVHSSYTFSAKEKDSETGLSYFGSRYYSSDLSIWLSVDPMSDKYPSLSPYVYCADNPVKLVDPNGEEIDDPPTEYNLTINGTTAILLTPDGSSKQYNLQDKKEYNNLLSNVNNALSAGSTVVGAVGIAGENSKATFRMTNSKGQLDFKFYANGWKGNQYITPTMLSKVAKGIKIGGNILGGISAGISFVQATQAKSTSERNWLIADGCAGLPALAGPIGMGASMYYYAVVKNAGKIFNMLKQDALDRADMMSKGYPAFRIGTR